MWACITVRLLIFSEIRFAFQPYLAGKAGSLYGTQALQLLETPWAQATTGDLLARMEVDASLYGNSYWVKSPGGDQLIRLTPSMVDIATTDAIDPISGNPYGKVLVGYLLRDDRGHIAATFLPNEVAHYKPLADPSNQFRGASWLGSLLPDVIADMDLTDYKHSFLQNAATPNLVVKFAPGISQEAFNAFRDKMESAHTGPQAGFKTLYLGGGADVQTVGSNFNDLAMQAVQSAGETRIAAAAGVPAGIVGLAEALRGSTLNAGNYAAIRRRFSDGTMRPLWRSAMGALQTLVAPPGGSRLWYDATDVMFLQEDVKDAASIRSSDAMTIHTLIAAGFFPETVITAVSTGDYSVLKHTGLVSVQLQHTPAPVPAGATEDFDEPHLPDVPVDDDQTDS
ncbi:MAG: putative phage protein [Acidimicrobiaceae bacterium]|nr:putative phage protein [Acidimicrobiaceae bacterium]